MIFSLQRNIFEDGGCRILIPFFREDGDTGLQYWDVADVDLAAQSINIYSPVEGRKNTRWKRLMVRIVKLIRHDYLARHESHSLDRIWSLEDLERDQVCELALGLISTQLNSRVALSPGRCHGISGSV